MSNGIRTCIVTVLFALLLITQACTQKKQAPDPLAYTPTGDALWDTYAQALLEQLPCIKADFGCDSTDAAILPDALLASWETDFGEDPRYWQMRFVNKVAIDNNATFQRWEPYDMFRFLDDDLHINPAIGTLRSTSPPDSVSFLKRSTELGMGDLASELLLFQFLKWRLSYIGENLEPGRKIEDEYFDIPQFEDEAAVASWVKQQKLGLADELVTKFPDESWGWYERARLQFEADNWEAGLDDLSTGNLAKFNRIPVCFPRSYIAQNATDKPVGGNRIAAGIVVEENVFLFDTMGSHLSIYKLFKDQIERIRTGSSTDELKPWQRAACRVASMENVSMGERIGGTTTAKILLRYFNTEAQDSLSEEQQVALELLDIESKKLMDTISVILKKEMSDSEASVEKIRTTLLEHGVNKDPWEIIGIGGGIENFEQNQVLNIALHEVHLREQYAVFEELYVNTSQKLNLQFDHLATYDFVTLSWSE